MLATVLTKSLRDRWLGVAIGVAAVSLFLLYGMAVYRDIDLSIYTDLPEAVRKLFGYTNATDAGGLAYGAIYGFAGALTLGGLAISIGAAAIAGEERNGTLGLLLASPRTRTEVLASKAASMVLLTGAGALALWGAGQVAPALLDVDTTGLRPGALLVHLLANALLYGFLALAVGAWTGNSTTAAGTATAVMVVSYLAVGILPLVEGLAGGARAFPWYYYDAGQPVVNGVQWGHLGVLAGAAAVLAAVAVVGVNRRDLRERSVKITLTDRLRASALTGRMMERLAGTTRVSRIAVKTASDHQGLLNVTGLIAAVMGVTMGPFYAVLDQDLRAFAEQLPEALMAMVGNPDLATPEGWYQTENFAFTLPIALIVLTTVIGARALAGEEQRRTMGLLLANPVSRSRVVVEKVAALVLHAAILGGVVFASTVAGSALGGLGMSWANIAAASLLLVLLGLVFGAVALVLGAATGRTRVAASGTAGLALALYLVSSLLPLSDGVATYARWSPFSYYLTSDPLTDGLRWSHAGILAGLTIALVVLAAVLFDRRDLRQQG